MTKDPFSWSEGSRLIGEVGREDHLAARITSERQARGWSQETLAREMTKAGCPIPQSAISKIENPAVGGRRAITVDEAIAFAKLFDIPLGELLLPQEALATVSTLRDLADGPSLLSGMLGAQQRYADLVRRLATATANDGYWAGQLADEMEDAIRQTQSQGRDLRDSVRVTFLREVIELREQISDELAKSPQPRKTSRKVAKR
jgi:transcriptional regulator with XRE-family HTH domain